MRVGASFKDMFEESCFLNTLLGLVRLWLLGFREPKFRSMAHGGSSGKGSRHFLYPSKP